MTFVRHGKNRGQYVFAKTNNLGGNGYPLRYTVLASGLLPVISSRKLARGLMEKQSENLSVWTIAGGVLLALVVWRAFNVWQYNRAVGEFNATMAKTLQEVQRSNATAREQYAERERQRVNAAAERQGRLDEARSLKSDERCINKQRFRRVANGWEQIGSC